MVPSSPCGQIVANDYEANEMSANHVFLTFNVRKIAFFVCSQAIFQVSNPKLAFFAMTVDFMSISKSLVLLVFCDAKLISR